MITAEKHFEGLLDLVVASLGAKGLDLERYLDLVSELDIKQEDVWDYIEDVLGSNSLSKDVDMVWGVYDYVLKTESGNHSNNGNSSDCIGEYLDKCVDAYSNYMCTSYSINTSIEDFCIDKADWDEELCATYKKEINDWLNAEHENKITKFLVDNIKELV